MPDEQQEPTMDEMYRAVFQYGFGPAVLADILAASSFWSTLDPDNKAMIGQHNMALRIAAKAGLFDQLGIVLGAAG